MDNSCIKSAYFDKLINDVETYSVTKEKASNQISQYNEQMSQFRRILQSDYGAPNFCGPIYWLIQEKGGIRENIAFQERGVAKKLIELKYSIRITTDSITLSYDNNRSTEKKTNAYVYKDARYTEHIPQTKDNWRPYAWAVTACTQAALLNAVYTNRAIHNIADNAKIDTQVQIVEESSTGVPCTIMVTYTEATGDMSAPVDSPDPIDGGTSVQAIPVLLAKRIEDADESLKKNYEKGKAQLQHNNESGVYTLRVLNGYADSVDLVIDFVERNTKNIKKAQLMGTIKEAKQAISCIKRWLDGFEYHMTSGRKARCSQIKATVCEALLDSFQNDIRNMPIVSCKNGTSGSTSNYTETALTRTVISSGKQIIDCTNHYVDSYMRYMTDGQKARYSQLKAAICEAILNVMENEASHIAAASPENGISDATSMIECTKEASDYFGRYMFDEQKKRCEQIQGKVFAKTLDTVKYEIEAIPSYPIKEALQNCANKAQTIDANINQLSYAITSRQRERYSQLRDDAISKREKLLCAEAERLRAAKDDRSFTEFVDTCMSKDDLQKHTEIREIYNKIRLANKAESQRKYQEALIKAREEERRQEKKRKKEARNDRRKKGILSLVLLLVVNIAAISVLYLISGESDHKYIPAIIAALAVSYGISIIVQAVFAIDRELVTMIASIAGIVVAFVAAMVVGANFFGALITVGLFNGLSTFIVYYLEYKLFE